MFEIKKIIKKGDYNYALVPDHPNCTNNGYVLLHRVIKENNIGRLLTKDEVIHHIDENKRNNDPSNLKIMNASDHSRLHRKVGRTVRKLICPVCDKEFVRELRQIKKNTIPKCSRKCSGIYSHSNKKGL